MRKVSTFLTLVALFVIGVTGAQAQYYDVPGFDTHSYIADVQPGQEFVMHNTFNTKVGTYWSGSGSTCLQVPDEGSIWTLESAGTKDGSPTYYLKQVSTGKYVGTAASWTVATLVDDVQNAQPLFVKHPTSFDGTGDDPSTITTFRPNDYHSYYAEITLEGSYIFTAADHAKANDLFYLLCYNEMWYSYSDTNAWFLFTPQPKSGYANLQAIFEECFPTYTSNLNPVGTDPGCVSQELQDALDAEFKKASDLLNSSTIDNDACQAEVAPLKEAYDAYKAGIQPMKAGYYYITSVGRDTYVGIYEDVNTKALRHTTAAFEKPAPLTMDEANYVWKVTEANDGRYYIQNYRTGHYATTTQYETTTTTLTTEGNRKEFIIASMDSYVGGAFSVKDNGGNYVWHLKGDGRIVGWYANTPASSFSFEAVPAEDLAAVEAEVEAEQARIAQEALNKAMNEKLAEVSGDYYNGITFKSDDDFSTFDSKGLVTEASQVWSNAKETSEGSYEALFDGIYNNADAEAGTYNSNYFHTSWSSASVNTYHNICVDLGEEIQTVVLRIARRQAASYDTAPWNVNFYATNDTTSGDWKWQGGYYFNYDQPIVVNDEEVANQAAVGGVRFDGKYRYLRMDVIHTHASYSNVGSGGSKVNGYPFFTMSEFRVFKAEVDEENSTNSYMDEAFLEQMEDLIQQGADELAAGKSTQETMDELTLIDTAYWTNYPSADKVTSVIDQAKALLEGAEEGTDPGYFEEGAKAELKAALDAVSAKVTDGMTLATIQALIAEVEEAVAKFNDKLVLPADGYYYLRARTTRAAANKYAYATGNGANSLRFGAYTEEGGIDTYLTDNARLNYIWKFERTEGNNFTIQNVATGTYMGSNLRSTSVPIPLRDEVSDSTQVSFAFAGQTGIFLIVLGEKSYANSDPQSRFVTWYDANDLNSMFSIEEVDADSWSESYYVDGTKPYFYTLPFEIEGEALDAELYSVLGYNANTNKVELQAYGRRDVIPAGTPFFVIPDEEDASVTGVEFTPTAGSLDEFEYSFDVENVNGLQATIFGGEEMGEGALVYNASNRRIDVAAANATAAANSAYFLTLPTTDEEGDAQISVSPAILTGVASVTKNVADGVAYDLQGRRVEKLAKGLYIINGKKVLVK